MDGTFRLLFIGDIVGPTGRAAIQRFVPELRRELRLDAVIANGENSADNGFGITVPIAETLLSVVDFITLGDHAFDQEEIGAFLDRDARIIRPLNFDGDRPGRGWGTFTVGGVRVGVANLLGRLFMQPAVQPPYAAADRAVQELQAAGANCIIVDMQAEATSEKMGLGWHLDGRATVVLGTHTHVPTADLRILPGGTAYVSDVGMTGGRDSIIGFDRQIFLDFMAGDRSRLPRPAEGPAHLDAVLIEIDSASGRALTIERVAREG
jgi:metallophosphoesterase (TIGR00282 family)